MFLGVRNKLGKARNGLTDGIDLVGHPSRQVVTETQHNAVYKPQKNKKARLPHKKTGNPRYHFSSRLAPSAFSSLRKVTAGLNQTLSAEQLGNDTF